MPILHYRTNIARHLLLQYMLSWEHDFVCFLIYVSMDGFLPCAYGVKSSESTVQSVGLSGQSFLSVSRYVTLLLLSLTYSYFHENWY